jgi:hypothetical protein
MVMFIGLLCGDPVTIQQGHPLLIDDVVIYTLSIDLT